MMDNETGTLQELGLENTLCYSHYWKASRRKAKLLVRKGTNFDTKDARNWSVELNL